MRGTLPLKFFDHLESGQLEALGVRRTERETIGLADFSFRSSACLARQGRIARRRRMSLASWLSCLVFLVACGVAPPSGPAVTAFDSAGIEIVEFDLDQVPEWGSVQSEPDWTFGQAADEENGVPLSKVQDATLLKDGRVVVVDAIELAVFLVDPADGRWERLGGRGQGPGEFEFIVSVSELHDGGIGVFDGVRREWMRFGEGGFLGSEKLPVIRAGGPAFPEVVLPDGDGFVIGDAYLPEENTGSAIVRRHVLVARVEGPIVDTITVIAGDTGVPKGVGVSALPFGPGYGIVIGDSGLWLGDSASPQVMSWTRGGELRRIVRWRSSEERRLTRGRIKAARDRVTAERPASVRASIRQIWKDTKFPSTVPAWGALIRGLDGILWISEYPGPESGWRLKDPYPARVWWGIGPSGYPVGKLLTPARLKVTGISGAYLIGIHTDRLGVETVRRHRIVVTSSATVND